MIDKELTKRRLGVTPYDGRDPRVKDEYRRLDYVVVRCDQCGEEYGKDGRILYKWVVKARERDGGVDVCLKCRGPRRNALHNFENARAEFVKALAANDGEVPRRDDLPGSLVGAINRYHGKYCKFLDRCGFELTKRRASHASRLGVPSKPHGYWKDWKNVRAELMPICEELGFFPPDQYLLQNGHLSLRSALKYFGGAAAAAKKIGYAIESGYEADDGHFVLSYYEFAVDNLLHAHGVPHDTYPVILQGDRRRGDFKVGQTFIEVAGYDRRESSRRHRTYFERFEQKLRLYESLNIDIVVIYKHDFNDITCVLRRLDPLFNRYGGDTSDVDIENAIRPISWWSEWQNVANQLSEVVAHLGHFPTAKELEQCGKSSVAHYIMKFHGGFAAARRRFGASLRQEAPGYFAKWKNVENIFRPICDDLGYFPSAREIRERKYGLIDCSSSLYKYWGSLQNVASRLGYPTKRQFNVAMREQQGTPPRRKAENELPKRRIRCECECCHRAFLARRKRKFCSRECYARTRRSIEPRECPVCGRRFRPVAARVKTCSRKCGQQLRYRLG